MKALFVHGIEDSGNSWEQTCAALPELDCETPDMPWSRGTDFGWLRDCATHEALAAEITRVRPDLCVAHSFGALTLIETLLRDPDCPRPRGIVLIAPFYLSEAERLDWYLLDRTRVEFTELMRDSIVSRAQRLGRTIGKDALDGMVATVMKGINPLAFTELFGHFALMRRCRLEHLGIPGRLLGSVDDPGFAGARAAELGGRLGLEVTLLPGRDHFLHYTAAQTVADVVRSLILKECHA